MRTMLNISVTTEHVTSQHTLSSELVTNALGRDITPREATIVKQWLQGVLAQCANEMIRTITPEALHQLLDSELVEQYDG